MGVIHFTVILLVMVTASNAPTTPVPTPAPTTAPTFAVTPDQLTWSEYRVKGWPAGSSTATVAGDPSKPCGWILRYRMPDGYRVPVHKNDVAEEATVLVGAYVMGVGSKSDRANAQIYPMGSYFRVDKGVSHYAWALGETLLEIRPVCATK